MANMITVFRSLPLALLFFMLAACGEQVSPEQDVDPVEIGSYFSFGTPNFLAADAMPDTPDHASAWSHLIMESNDLALNAESVEAADLALRAAASKTDDSIPPYVAEQARSRAFLINSGVFDQPRTEDNIELVRTHLNVLVRNNSPEARLGLQSIEYLEGAAPDDELRQAAHTIGTAAMEQLEKECHMCEAARQSKPDLYRGLMDYFESEQNAAANLLSYR